MIRPSFTLWNEWKRPLVGPATFGGMMISILIFSCPHAALAQDKISDEVGVVVSRGRVLGVTSGSGLVRARLSAGETVVFTEDTSRDLLTNLDRINLSGFERTED